MSELWQEEAKRIGGPIFAEVLVEIRDGLAATRAELAENTRKTEQVLRAFPAGDTDGHRRYHESVIEWRDVRNKMVKEGLIKVAQAGMLGGAGILLALFWRAFKISVTQ